MQIKKPEHEKPRYPAKQPSLAWIWIKTNMPELAKEMLAHPGFMHPVRLRDR